MLSKKERTAVVMAYVLRGNEAEVFGPVTADLERGVKKLEPQVEESYKRNQTHGETNPDKASKELLENHEADVAKLPTQEVDSFKSWSTNQI